MSTFWTQTQLERARALRWYRRLWAACPAAEQWRHECRVYRLRGMGLPEKEVGRVVEEALNRSRPWRMTDRELGAALNARYRGQRRGGGPRR